MHRFFLPAEAFQGDAIRFPPETAHQILRVLRLRVGEKILCLDNHGWEYLVEMTEIGSSQVQGRVIEKKQADSEPAVRLHIFLCLSQREKFEWMLQKCTEVGVSEFTPVLSSRSLVQDSRSMENKVPRWNKILQEAAEQSGRGLIPRLNPAKDYTDALNAVSTCDICLLAWEGEKTLRLTEALQGQKKDAAVALLIGPEGGLSEEEAMQAQNKGWRPVSLGRRILRMETAAVVAAALTVDWFESLPN